MRASLKIIFLASTAAPLFGCTVQYVNPPSDPSPVVDDDTPPDVPVVDDPTVVVIDDEPPPPERVYIYDPGYPPGTYYYGGYYYYGRYRYPHDVFVHRYVDVNVREHRYVDVQRNRQMGQPMVYRQREDYARTGGHHATYRQGPGGSSSRGGHDRQGRPDGQGGGPGGGQGGPGGGHDDRSHH